MLQGHFNTQATVKRTVLTGRKTTFVSDAITRGHIQPATSEYQLHAAGAYAKNFIFLTDYDLVIGDHLVIDNKEYTVHGIQSHNFRIGKRHTEAYIHVN